MDAKIGTEKKDDAADVAKLGFDARMNGGGDIVSAWKNKLQPAAANVMPSGVPAKQRKTAEPPSSEGQHYREEKP